MPNSNIIKLYVLFACFILLVSSCKKFVEVDPPVQNIIGDNAFSDSTTATATVTGLYSRMMGTSTLQLATGGITIYSGLYADELYNVTTANSAELFYLNAIPVYDAILRDRFWLRPYSFIYHSNACIEGLEKAGQLSIRLRQQLLGECKLVRAWLYFNLVNLFGDVPLITVTDYRQNAMAPRTAEAEVWKQIVTDLVDAKSLLSHGYPSAQRARPNKWTAAAFLSRVYLFRKEWQKAEQEASEVISSGMYSLNTQLNSVFLLGSNETIWQLLSSLPAQNNTAEGFLFIPATATARPSYPMTNSLLAGFEAGDQRRTAWTKSVTVAGQQYTYPFKYKVRGSTTTPVTEGTTIFRLAETLLIRAEARAHLNNLTGPSSALTDVNTVRTRAGLLPLSLTAQEDILAAIYKERRLEFFSEMGSRWFDLKRNGLTDQVLGGKPGWTSTDINFPIPQLEIDRNPNLHQNPGY